jgi:hypothetical protein
MAYPTLSTDFTDKEWEVIQPLPSKARRIRRMQIKSLNTQEGKCLRQSFMF